MNDNKQIILSNIKIAQQFLYLAELTLDGLVNKSNNLCVIVSFNPPTKENGSIDMDAMERQLNEDTKYSDFRLIFPTLFVLYHGLELEMKSLIQFKDPQSKSLDKHNFNFLYQEILKLYVDERELHLIIKKFICWKDLPKLIKQFCEINGRTNIDDLYEMLRYGCDKSHENIRDISGLDYQGNTGKECWDAVLEDLKQLSLRMTTVQRALLNL